MISIIQPSQFKSFLVAKMSPAENFGMQEKKEKTEDILDFQVDFFELLDDGNRQLEKDKRNKDNLSQDLDDFIAVARREKLNIFLTLFLGCTINRSLP